MEHIITTCEYVAKLMYLVNWVRDIATLITNVLMDFFVDETIARKICPMSILCGVIITIAAIVSLGNLEISSERMIS